MIRVIQPVLSLSVALALLTGCRSHHAGPLKHLNCLIDAEDAAAMNQVVAKLYTEGEMGTPAEFKARYFYDVPRSAYLGPDGQLKPFQELSGNALTDAQKMINGHLTVSPFPYVDQIEAAMARARKHLTC